MALLSDKASGQAVRAFIGVEKISQKEGDLTIKSSIKENSTVSRGTITDSILVNSDIQEADISGSIIQHSRLNKVRGKGGIVFNVVDNEEIIIEEGMMIFDVFHPEQGRLRFKFKIGEEKTDKELWWSVVIHGNPMSLEELSKLMRYVPIDEIRAARERFIKDNARNPAGESSHSPVPLPDVKIRLPQEKRRS